MQQIKHNQPQTWSTRIFQWTGFTLVSTVWLSSGLFGLYILAFYTAALYQGNMERWNEILPNLHSPGAAGANTGIGMHFAAGGIILVLGSIQLIESVRNRYPALHRWIGRLYVSSSLLAAVGGLAYIFLKGTIGGTVMDIGFGLYGVLMFAAAVQTWRHAAARRIEQHRAWALRLYALAIGSWLYRMDYGFWLLLADGLGHEQNFSGPFDQVMAFFFYLPNLLVAEIFIRGGKPKTAVWFHLLSSVALLGVTGFLLLGTYYFTKFYWGPAILEWIAGRAISG